MTYIINYPERLEKAIKALVDLREALLDAQSGDPHLFQSRRNDDAPITDGWEFWTTDEILERIASEVSEVLTKATCKKSLQVEFVGNPDDEHYGK